MNDYTRYEVTIKYTRHPYLKDGTPDFKQVESTSWFTTIYPDGKTKLTENIAKDTGRKQFLAEQVSYLKIDQVRATKQTYNDKTEKWS